MLLSAFLSACTQGVDQADTLVPVDTAFSRTGEAERQSNWWLTFEDPRLNELIKEGLETNPDLESVWARLKASQALAQRQRSDLFPELDGLLGAETQNDGNNSSDFLSAGLSASYEVDLWGRIRSETEAARLRAEAAEADYETAALTLTGEIALAWYRLLARMETLALIEDQIAANEKVAESLITRFSSGEARSVDVLRQEQLIESTNELKLITVADIAVLKNQLQVLIGNVPQKPFQVEKNQLPTLAALPEVGMPADLLLRRPDIRSAYLELKATDRDLASAISARYPRIDLTATLRTTDEGDSDLFDDWLRRAAADLVAPIIDGGNRRAEVDRQEAIKRQRIAEFTQASLLAYSEVENALVQEQQEGLRQTSLSKQVELQQTAFDQLQKEFLNGVGNFIDVLTAQTGTQQLQRDLIESKRRQIEFRIALHRSIAGPIDYKADRKSL